MIPCRADPQKRQWQSHYSTSEKGEAPSLLPQEASAASSKEMGTPSASTGGAIVIAVESEKGGQGKTTTGANLAMMLTLLGRKVLIIDCNPDGGLTFSLGYDKDQFETSAYEVILDEAKETRTRTFQQVIVQTWYSPETRGFFDPNQRVVSADPASPVARFP